MDKLIPEIPTIAITGSSGKTTTREFISSILETKWKVLKTVDNKNLPKHIEETIKLYNPSYQAILLELGMGKQGAGIKHCNIIQPNISVITNIGSAHYGNLGNSIETTAKFKSVLIQNMNQNGVLLINNDDENSKLLLTDDFKGKIITLGIKKDSDYQVKNTTYVNNGMSFNVVINGKNEEFYIPVFGTHNVYNALFAIAITYHLKFTPDDIRIGLKKFAPPIKRLNFIKLSNKSILIDDTVNANPQSVKAALDVMEEIGASSKKIVVLGDMLELGDYTKKAHIEIGEYLASKKVDTILTYGIESRSITTGALSAGYPPSKLKHFENRDELHSFLKNSIEPNSLILVKGSSAMKMDKTVRYVFDRFFYSIFIDNISDQSVHLSNATLEKMNINLEKITLHFGQLKMNLTIKIDNSLELGKIILPCILTEKITIPDLPYEYYLESNHLYLGPVIGLLILPRYYDDPKQQILRFSNYNTIKGLIFLFKQSSINMRNKIITGYYYNPETKEFNLGTFPYPSVIFNRISLDPKIYKHLIRNVGNNLFNYPYANTNKLLFWIRMSKIPKIKEHLPVTKEYKSISNLTQMLDVYKSVYLKPTTLAGGNGIMLVKKVDTGYILIDQDGELATTNSKKRLSNLIKNKLIKNKKYIIQQGITFQYNTNKIDFRVYLQKDKNKRWRYSGMETKIAKEGSIISNSKNRIKIVPGITTLRETYHLTEQQAEHKINEITELAISVLKRMEDYGFSIADIAVDLIIDETLKIWLLEVQINYAAEIKASRSEDEGLILPLILPTPLEYAKALAGF
ncbi:MAG: YheC/YheD family protein [Vulcanibacillus sp.]